MAAMTEILIMGAIATAVVLIAAAALTISHGDEQ